MIGRMSLLVLVLLAGCGAAPVMSDAALVYCTSHRSETVDAAVALGVGNSTAFGNRIVVDGNTLEFDEWRRTRQPEFQRACAAAAEPQMRPPAPSSASPWVTAAITAIASLLGTFLGAGITWVATNRREDRNRAVEHGIALRKASREFVDEVRAYRDAQLKGPATGTELRRKRDLLNTQLAVTTLMRPKWIAPGALRTELDAFAASAEERWHYKSDRRELEPRAAEVMKEVQALDRRIEVVVQALQRPADADELLTAEFGQVAAA